MKRTIASISIAALLIFGALLVVKNQGQNSQNPEVNNVSVVNGTQIIEIYARGGYAPRVSQAQAGMPTILRVKTQGTFDCSAAMSIPSLGYQKILPASGVTDIEVPSQKAGTVLQGLCAMGMYNFAVQFN